MGNFAPRSVFTNSGAGTGQNPNTGPGLSTLQLNQGAIRELPGALPPQDVIIHDGAISGFESAALIVDTEGEAAADELNVINIVLSANENLHPGMIITLRAKDQARTVTVKNSAAANGINTAGGHDVVLSTEWDLVLRLVAGRWYEIQTRGDVRASDAQTDASTALARTAPATTTSRGIGRVATSADLVDGATITNGPAFLSAGDTAVKTWLRYPYWISRAIGEEVWLDDSNPAVDVPPTDNPNFRFIKLTAGENGSGGYNEGVLINENVSGSAPLIEATAEINLPDSPFHGQTIRLLNTERRFVRAGEAGVAQDDAFQGHSILARYKATGGTPVVENFKNLTGVTPAHIEPQLSGVISAPLQSDGTNGTPRTASETRPRNIGRTVYMRIL